MSYLQDPDFQEVLLALVCRDRMFLREHGHLLTSEDFKPQSEDPASRNRWVIAERALSHWEKYKEPIGDLLPAELSKYAKDARLGEKRTHLLKLTGKQILKRNIAGIQAVTERLTDFKRNALFSQAIEELVTLHASGELTNERFLSAARSVVDFENQKKEAVTDYFDGLELRIERRQLGGGDERYPVFFIDPLDAITRGIAKGHLGCVVGPYKRGKSQFLIWLAIAYTIQKLNVLYITLEDPKEDVEDRFDAAVANLPIKSLHNKPKTLRKHFRLFKRVVRGRLKIYDGTDQGMTVRDIEQIWLQEREAGFIADAIIVDYDDEIRPSKKNPERRHEIAEVYRDLRRMGARHHLLVWTAAQTQRKTEDLKILSGDKLAEDISKARKVSCLITMGKGDWGPDSIHFYVAAHKFNKQHVGCTVFANRDNMLIYDRARTLAKTRELASRAAKKGKAA